MGGVSLQDVMGKRFREIKRNFQRASFRNGFKFDEDVFIDTYIKCCEHLKNTDMDEKQLIQYYWVSFVNNMKKEYRQKFYRIEEVEIKDEEEIEIIDENYDDRREKVYDYIISHVKENFDNDSFKMWYLHFAENKDYEDLKNMGYIDTNFHNLFRNINNSIKNKLPKINKDYNNIIQEIFRKK